MSKRKKHNDEGKCCHTCANCMYIGEGDSVCDVTMEVVLEDWEPTDEYYWCGGKEFIAI